MGPLWKATVGIRFDRQKNVDDMISAEFDAPVNETFMAKFRQALDGFDAVKVKESSSKISSDEWREYYYRVGNQVLKIRTDGKSEFKLSGPANLTKQVARSVDFKPTFS